MSPARLLIATRNRGKVREILAGLADLPLECATLEAFPDLPEPAEVADTFEGNATDKAVYYARQTAMWCLADDSGLEVDALGGAPGVRSARYAGRQGDDHANNVRLIAALRAVPTARRTARFRCVMVLADAAGPIARAEGVVEGIIVDEPQGRNGFGYDPHFFVPSQGMTAAQLPPDLKNRISHRGQALRCIRPAIESLAVTASPYSREAPAPRSPASGGADPGA